MMRTAFELARFGWRDLAASGRHLWVFWACLMLGITLIAGTGGLYKQVSDGLLTDSRALFGGDVRVDSRAPLDAAVLRWMRARGRVSLLVELRTMALAGERTQLVELQVVDEAYPLYGRVELAPRQTLSEAVAKRDGSFGTAIDAVLARRLALAPGDRLAIGYLDLEVRAIIERQPDRSLSADWRGLPVLLSVDALEPSGLLGPGSRLDYEYRVAVDSDVAAWAQALDEAFPDAEFEVRTFEARSGRIAEVLGQAASALLLIGFSALLVGGIGVFNSVRAHLDTKLPTIATLRAMGLRERPLAAIYLAQISALGASAALAGALSGGALAWLAAAVVAERLPVSASPWSLAGPLATAWLFGVLIAVTFALPALGRALSVTPAALFRGIDSASASTPRAWWLTTGLFALLTAASILAAMPDPVFGIAFVGVALALIALLESLVRAISAAARRFGDHPALGARFTLRLALANLCRRGSPLRVTLISLGSALTVLVASSVVVIALLETIEQTIPERAPALVFYDVANGQTGALRELAEATRSFEEIRLAPLVLGRMEAVNGERLRDSGDAARARESRDEHKLSYRAGNIDEVSIVDGQWWPDDYSGTPLVAFEDREAGPLGLAIGDRVSFEILGETVEARLAAIYSQRGIGTRFWFEGIFSDGALDPFITRHVGTAYLGHDEAIALETRIAEAMPNIVTARTARLLDEARTVLGRAAMGLAVIAAVALLASLLVLASVIAASRARRSYDAAVLHALGARLRVIRASLAMEYVLIAVLTSAFAIGLGFAIAWLLLEWRLRIEADAAWWWAAMLGCATSAASLGLGAAALLRTLRLAPAVLLKSSG